MLSYARLTKSLVGRSLDDVAAFLLADPVALKAAADKLSAGKDLTEQEADLLESVIDHLEPDEGGSEDGNNGDGNGPGSGGGLMAGSMSSSEPAGEERAVDNTAWDGPAAMSKALASSDPAAAFGSICAGRKSGPPEQESSWALPHHKSQGADPNAAGVRNALSRLPQTQGLTNHGAAQSHLDAHMGSITAAEKKSADLDLAALERAMIATPTTADAMSSHCRAAKPDGHGMVASAVDGKTMAEMKKSHDAAHNSGASHIHPAGTGSASARPPRDNLVRAMAKSPSLRAADPAPGAAAPDPSAMPTMFGHFARFNEWTEIDSFWEGNFMERIAPGAFKKTIAENQRAVRVLFNHGQDPHIGDKVLGAITDLREDSQGAYYEVPLFDTSYNRDLVPGLRAEQYGASFRFLVMKEEFVQNAKPSGYNPTGLPERTIKEVALAEFGPVTFPAYASATAGVRSSALRSLTDAFILEGMAARDPEKLARLLKVRADSLEAEGRSEERPVDHVADAALDEDGAGGTHSEPDESRDDVEPVAADETTTPDVPADDSGTSPEPATAQAETDEEENRNMPPTPSNPVGRTIEERRSRADEIANRFQEIHAQYGAVTLPDEIRGEWDAMVVEREENRVAIADYEWRTRQLADMSRDADRHVSVGLDDQLRTRPRPANGRVAIPDNIYAVEDYRQFATSLDQLRMGFHDGAMRAIERTSFPHPRITSDQARAHIARLLDTRDNAEGAFAQRILVTGSPVYERAFGKTLKGSPLTSEEQRALSLGSDPDGGFAVPFQLDPTVILTSDGAINPLRQISRVEQIVGKEWMGVTSEGITASYAGEAEEADDDAPVLTQPVVQTLRAQAFVPFSVELGQDWGSLQGEMATLLSDAKDILEADKFVNGIGPTTEPGGVVETLDDASKLETIGSNAFAIGDLYALEEAVPPRFRAKAQFMANRSIYNKVRQFDTYGGAALWVRLIDGLGNELVGYPANECSTMDGTLSDADLILLLGDFSKFLIVDRMGMSIELIPHLFGVSGRPTGQRGIYAIWRNSSVILVDNAFRLLKVKA